MRSLEAVDVPLPEHWPGSCDPKLDRPDLLKFEVCTAATNTEPGGSKLKQLESALRKGALGHIPEIEHWAMEEFFWHGLPGDSWHPIESFMAQHSEFFSPAAQEQIRRWKEARIGLFEVGEVRDDTVTLQEWDAIGGSLMGTAFRAITLNIGGVNAYCNLLGKITLTYVAPWSPADNLYCGMGYGITLERPLAAMLLPLLNLCRPDLAAKPLPWQTGTAARSEYLAMWRSREWYSWLRDRLQFPVHALVITPPANRPQVKQVTGLVPVTPEQARQFGIYLEVPMGKEMLIAGATAVTPFDVTSPNLLALYEYHAYRARVGPPPGMRGKPAFMTL
jgi:hypothetical protein